MSAIDMLDRALDQAPTDPLLDDEPPTEAHVVNKAASAEGYVLGTPVTALCGKVFVPSRKPEDLPLCPLCKELWGMIGKQFEDE